MYAPLGSISTGTLDAAELARNFIDALESFAAKDDDLERKAQALLATQAAKQALKEQNDAALGEFTSTEAFELLEAYAPPYSWFGAHPHDGADFGYWPAIESLMEAARGKDGVVSVPAGDAWPSLAADIEHVVEVNDHGNVMLFDARTRQGIWSCV
jgi:hypothetical protein